MGIDQLREYRFDLFTDFGIVGFPTANSLGVLLGWSKEVKGKIGFIGKFDWITQDLGFFKHRLGYFVIMLVG